MMFPLMMFSCSIPQESVGSKCLGAGRKLRLLLAYAAYSIFALFTCFIQRFSA